MAAKCRPAAGSVFCFVGVDVVCGRLLHRVAVRQLLIDQHGSGRKHPAVAVLTDDAKEIGIGNAMRLIDLPLVAARDQFLVRRCRRRSGSADQHRVGLRGKDFQNLTGDARIVAVVFLLGYKLDARGLRRALYFPKPAVAVRVGEADEAHRAHAVGAHMNRDRVRHQRVILRSLEHPFGFRVGGQDDGRGRRHRDHRNFGLEHHVTHGQGIGRYRRSNDHVDVILTQQFARVLDRFGRVRLVVEDDEVELLPADRRRADHLERIFFRNAERRRRTGRRERNADIDVGDGDASRQQRRQGKREFFGSHHFPP